MTTRAPTRAPLTASYPLVIDKQLSSFPRLWDSSLLDSLDTRPPDLSCLGLAEYSGVLKPKIEFVFILSKISSHHCTSLTVK